MLCIGIDVGITGALASIDHAGTVVCLRDLPLTVYGKQKWVNGGDLLRALFAARRGTEPARVFVEYTPAFPLNRDADSETSGLARGNNLNSASKKGMVLGSILSILEVAELPFELVVPQKWKRALDMLMPKASYHERKEASLERARALFPKAPLHLQKHNGRAEALLIAHWAQRYVLGVQGPSAAAAAVGELDLVGGGKAA